MLPQIHWSVLLPGGLNAPVRERDTGVDGNVTAEELEILASACRLTDPDVVFEFGTFDGRTTLNLAFNCAPTARVYTLDLPRSGMDSTALHLARADRRYIDKPQSGTRFLGSEVEHKIIQLYGDSATFDYRPFYGKVDFIFIDASHSYEYVLSDSRNALRMIRPGGLVLWHDYASSGPIHWPGLVRALEELQAGDPYFRDLKHIADTKLAVLRVHRPLPPEAWYAKWLRLLGRQTTRLNEKLFQPADSRQPKGLKADLQVTLPRTAVRSGEPLQVQVTVKNIGTAAWLPATAEHGPVLLGCHLLDPSGRSLNHDHAHRPITPIEHGPILQGESMSFETSIPCPPKGRYVLEFDLVAEGVCWFAGNGSRTVKVPLEVN